VKRSGVGWIREVSSVANDGLCDGDVKKGGLATYGGEQGGGVWLCRRERGEDGSETSGGVSGGHQQDRDVASWDCACPWQSRVAEQDDGRGIGFVGGV
jgi:hypothetical protein